MGKQSNTKGGYLGGLSLLAAVSCLCLKGLKQVDKQLKKSTKKNEHPEK